MEPIEPGGWWIYRGSGEPIDPAERDRRWPQPPPWRRFVGEPVDQNPPQEDPAVLGRLGLNASAGVPISRTEVDTVNAALYLRRPILISGPPGSGRSTLASRVAHELGLGRVLRWVITSETTVHEGLYEYDSAGHASMPAADPQTFIRLGPLGTALVPTRMPRVLLVQDVDQGDFAFAQDLRVVLENGGFDLRELRRPRASTPSASVDTADPDRHVPVANGRIDCHEFPVVVLTCSDDRNLPEAMRLMCLRIVAGDPDEAALLRLIGARFPDVNPDSEIVAAVHAYLGLRRQGVGRIGLRDLLDAIHLHTHGASSAVGSDGITDLLRAVSSQSTG